MMFLLVVDPGNYDIPLTEGKSLPLCL